MQQENSKTIVPYAFFFLIGIILLSFAVIFELTGKNFWFGLFLNLGASVITVVIVEFLWKYLGSNPISKAIARLVTATSLLRDLDGTGIERIYPQREKVDLEKWIALIKSAREVDMMGNVLRANWAKNKEFCNILSERTSKKQCKFRILIFDPKSNFAEQRVLELGRKQEAMIGEIKESLDIFQEIKNDLKGAIGEEDANEFLKIKVVNKSNMYCSVIRADEKLLVTNYLCYLTGSPSPTIEIHGITGYFFKIYSQEFEKMWVKSEDPPKSST